MPKQAYSLSSSKVDPPCDENANFRLLSHWLQLQLLHDCLWEETDKIGATEGVDLFTIFRGISSTLLQEEQEGQVLLLTAECKAAVGAFVEHLKGKDDSLALADERMADEHVKILAHVRRLSWS